MSERREIELEGRTIPYELRRSLRARNLRADIGMRTGLRLTLPEGMPESRGTAFLQSRRRWVLRSLDRLTRLAAIIPQYSLEHGSTVPFLGSALTLNVSIDRGARAERLGDSLIVHAPRRTRASLRSAIEGWYRREAGRILGEHARRLGAAHGLVFRRVIIRDQKRRWGSCSSSGTLSFNWRLLLGPEAVMIYIVAHELAHIAEPNHSKRFWAKVAELCPGYWDCERWLKKNGVSLTL